MGSVSFENIVEARARALEDGEIAVKVRLTKDAIESLKGDEKAVTTDDDQFLPDDEDIIGRVNALDVIEGDQNVIITETGTEYSIDT